MNEKKEQLPEHIWTKDGCQRIGIHFVGALLSGDHNQKCHQVLESGVVALWKRGQQSPHLSNIPIGIANARYKHNTRRVQVQHKERAGTTHGKCVDNTRKVQAQERKVQAQPRKCTRQKSEIQWTFSKSFAHNCSVIKWMVGH